MRRLVVISAGLSVPSSTRLLAERLAGAAVSAIEARGARVEVEHVELRPLAHPLADHLLTGFASGDLADAIAKVRRADGLVVVSDRHNHRIRWFTPDGIHLRDHHGLGATQCIAFAPDGTPWITAYRDVVELIAQDSLGGRLFELDPDSWEIRRSLDVNAHWVHPTAEGHLWLACLAGSVTHLYPGWIAEQDGGVDEREYLRRDEDEPAAGG